MTGRFRRTTARLLAVVPLAGVALGALALPAAAAATKVTSVGQCVWNNGDGTYTGVFGYTSTAAVTIPVGANNQVYVGHSSSNYWTAGVQPQPTNFIKGTVTSAFTVNFPADGGAAWSINGGYDSLMATDVACSTSPVDVISDGPLAIIGFALLVPAGAYFLSRPSTRLGRSR